MRNKTFKINDQTYQINLEDWCFSKDKNCLILQEKGNNLILENRNGIQFLIPTYLVEANQLAIKNGAVELSEGLYKTYLLHPEHTRIQQDKNILFQKHCTAIFQHPEAVFERPEFMLIRPQSFFTHTAYSNLKFSPSLGEMLSSIQSETHLHFDEIDGYRDVYVIQMAGSPLSGSYNALLWSKAAQEFINVSTQKMLPSKLPGRFIDNLNAFVEGFTKLDLPQIDFDHKALEALVKRIER